MIVNDRYKPTRAGIVNVWDYVDEEFVFGDGRLALRGHNGSGKTKALEVLFPFILDGSLDARRLDPFSGENRTMKSNLLYRGQESEYGFVWMEFARQGDDGAPTDVVTLVIGLQAHRAWDRPRASFFVTDQRMGVDFGLLAADSRPLTAKQLTAVLGPDARKDNKTEYQAAVDDRLFGLGPQRYTQLLDLLIALRRPLLAKDLDPVKVSDTLTAGLSPVDDELIAQAARDFDNLHAVQTDHDNLTAADTAVKAFLVQYTQYLRVYARNQVDHVESRLATAGTHLDRLAEAARTVSEERRLFGEARTAHGDTQKSIEILRASREALTSLDAYTEHGNLTQRRTELDKENSDLKRTEQRLARELGNITDLVRESEARKLELEQKQAAVLRHRQQLADAAARSGITDDGQGPADTGDDLAATAAARIAARSQEIAEVREYLKKVSDVERDHAVADSQLTAAATDLNTRSTQYEGAEQSLAEVRATATNKLRAWVNDWVSGDEYAIAVAADVRLLSKALEAIGEEDAPGITEVFDAMTQSRRAAILDRRGELRATAAGLAKQIEARQAERDSVAAEHDDAPRANPARSAEREGRGGAPLWQLVRFADGLDEQVAAAIEGALHGAGLLDAWIYPDTRSSSQALDQAVDDGQLVELPMSRRPRGRTLADVLLVEQQELVPAQIVADVLASVALTDDLVSHEPDDSVAPAVTVRAQYRTGPLTGAHSSAHPEYIGATNRASRRRTRLADLDATLAALRAEHTSTIDEITRIDELDRAFVRSRNALPAAGPITAAIGELKTAAALLADARTRHSTARETLEQCAALLESARRTLRREAAARRLPPHADAIEAMALAVTDFAAAAGHLTRERAETATLTRTLSTDLERIERLTEQHTADAEDFTNSKTEYEAARAALEQREAAVDDDYHEVVRKIRAVDEKLDEHRANLKKLADQMTKHNNEEISAQTDERHEREALTTSIGDLFDQLSQIEPVLRPDLRPLLNIAHSAPWPAVWPAVDDVTRDLAATATSSRCTGPGHEAVRATLPGAAADLLAAYAAATRGGRAPTEGAVSTAADRVWEAFRELETALKSGDDGYQAQMSGHAPLIVEVAGADGRVPVAAFARKIAEDLADLGVLLEQRERAVLEDALLTSLAQQIHDRAVSARDLVAAMDADTRSKPMTAGTVIGIGWVRAQGLTEQQLAASRLLERDAAALGDQGLEELRSLIRAMIREHRLRKSRDTYREALAAVLDYRAWHVFELRLTRPGGKTEILTRKKHSQMSGGEKSASIHMPLFAAANALYSSAKRTCPRMVALDEAFAGIDNRFTPDLLELTVKFDLDLFMTGHDLWVRYPQVPMTVHYDLHHDEATHTVSALLVLWDGAQLIDADAGFAGNDELAAELLGFSPTRRLPGQDSTALLGLLNQDDEEAADEAEA